MKNCPICGAKGSFTKGTKVCTAKYNNYSVLKNIEIYSCANCDAELDLENEVKNEAIMKNAYELARKEYVSNKLADLEKNYSFVDIERSFSLPPKTLSKWKNKTKSPSAAAAALVSLIGVFPWLSYIGLADYNEQDAYKIAAASVFNELTKNPDNFPFGYTDDNRLVVGICKIKQKVFTDKITSNSIFGGNYVN